MALHDSGMLEFARLADTIFFVNIDFFRIASVDAEMHWIRASRGLKGPNKETPFSRNFSSIPITSVILE